MSTDSRKNTKHKIIGYSRLGVQALAMALTVAGMFAMVRSMGLPKWLFTGVIIVVGMFFCGWVCPFGALQEWLRKAGKGLTGLTLRIPERINRYLLLSRYAIPVLGAVFVLSALDSRRTFVMTLAGRTAEIAAYVCLGVILALSLFMDRPFCKYLCGFGAVSGLSSMLRIFTIKRNREKCVDCGKCTRSCVMGVEVAKANNVRDPHCIQCGICVASCPVPGALKAGFALPCLDDARALKEKYLPRKNNDDQQNRAA